MIQKSSEIEVGAHPGIGREDSAPSDTKNIIATLDAGFQRLPQMFDGMDKMFHPYFPFDVAPWSVGLGRKIVQRLRPQSSFDQKAHPVVLDPIRAVRQQSGSDCVGAGFMSAMSEITGISTTPELYEGFLQAAIEHKLAEKEEEGTKVLPYVFNVFSTPEFRQQFPSHEVTVAYRQNLSRDELSEIIEITKGKKNPPYSLFVFLPFSSFETLGGGHLVTLSEIHPTETTVYDPKLGEKRVLSNDEFDERWNHVDRSAIFVFSAQNLKQK